MVERGENAINGIERDISQETKSASIVGKHILSRRLVENSQREGDGYLIVETGTGNLVIAVIDISLGTSSSAKPSEENPLSKIVQSKELADLMPNIPPPPVILQENTQKQITESRILTDLKTALSALIKDDKSSASNPTVLLDNVRNHFYPTYLIRPYFSRHSLWGFSISAAYLVNKETIIIASIGKNFVGRQSPDKENQFTSLFGDNHQFYSWEKTHRRVGAPVKTKTASLPWGTTFIMATDGIEQKKGPLSSPKIILQQETKGIIIPNNDEGLYLLVKPKTF